MRKLVLAFIAAGLLGAWAVAELDNGEGEIVTVTPTVTRVVYSTDKADRVDLVNLGSTTAFVGYNCTTAQWATIHATTSGIPIAAGMAFSIAPKTRVEIGSVCIEMLDGGSTTVHVAAQ